MTNLPSAKSKLSANYLWRRTNSRNLWFRHWVPQRYRAVEPKKLIQKSLGTPEKGKAQLRAAALLLELHASWENRLSAAAIWGGGQASPTIPDLQLAATEAAFLKIQPKLDRLWNQEATSSVQAFDATLRKLRSKREEFVRERHWEKLPLWRKVADREILRRGWQLESGSSQYEQFLQMIAEAAIEVLNLEIANREGNFGAQPTSPIVLAGLAIEKERARPGETIKELFERYASQRLAEKRKRPDTVDQDRKVIVVLADFLGDDRSVRSIAPIDIREWRDAVAALPANYKKSAAYKGLRLREAATKARSTGAQPIAATTVNKYLSTASPLFDWCVTNGYADRNPCDGLFYDVQKGKNPRPPFTQDQLQKIFSSPLFTGFAADGEEHKPGTSRSDDWRYWIPLMCLFTGARIGEMAQVRTDDVGVADGIPYILIRHDEKRGQSTKSGHSRVAPVHSKMQSLGFLDFVERQRRAVGNDGKLFPDIQPSARGQIGAMPSRFWRKYLSKIGVKGERDGVGAHSFRHTLADLLRQVGYLDDEIEVALGHNQKTVTAGYGRLRQGTVGRISAMLEAVPFEDLFDDFPKSESE